jgi:cobalamin biosynthesis Mg chelatase CobN
MGGFETTLPESVPSSGRGASQSSYSEDDVSVSSGSSSSSSSVSHMEVESRDGTAESESAIEFAKTENQKVRVWRYVVFIVLLITGVIITLATYLFLDKSADADHQETVRLKR